MAGLVVIREGDERLHEANPRKIRTTLCGLPWARLRRKSESRTVECPDCLRLKGAKR